MKISGIIAVIALVSIVSVSGCIDLGGFKSVFSSGEVTKATPDLIIIKDTSVIPKPPVPADTPFTYSFSIYNNGDKNPEINDIKVKLYDWGMCGTSKEEKYEYLTNLSPASEELIEFKLTAPANNLLVGLQNQCSLKYKINYNFKAESSIDMRVISQDKLTQMQKAGQTPSFTPSQNIGIGPMKITFGYDAELPISSGSILPINVVITDEGSGMMKMTDGKIAPGLIELQVPADFVKVSCDKFGTPTETEKSGVKYNVYKNSQDITMIKSKTPELRCSFTAPPTDDERTYLFYANMGYTYELDNEQSVAVKPVITG